MLEEPDSQQPFIDEKASVGTMSKHERKQLHRHEKKQKQQAEARARRHGKLAWRIILGTIVAVAIAGIAWLMTQSNPSNPDIVSARGIHWHADLIITIKGKPVEIPSNIGLGPVHADMHTHTVNDQIHIEIRRAVRREDTRLGNFFDIWGKEFTSQCLLGSCNGPEGMLTMLVNGQENKEFENYRIQDRDRIELQYE